jgi:hypothetical protein
MLNRFIAFNITAKKNMSWGFCRAMWMKLNFYFEYKMNSLVRLKLIISSELSSQKNTFEFAVFEDFFLRFFSDFSFWMNVWISKIEWIRNVCYQLFSECKLDEIENMNTWELRRYLFDLILLTQSWIFSCFWLESWIRYTCWGSYRKF